MKPLTRETLKGVWGTLLLPLRDDDSINFELLEQELHHLIAAGVAGIYSNGSAGEFWTQSEEEFDRINGILAEVCSKAGMPFQIGASHTSPQGTLGLIHRARVLRPSGMQVILPDWLPPRPASSSSTARSGCCPCKWGRRRLRSVRPFTTCQG